MANYPLTGGRRERATFYASIDDSLTIPQNACGVSTASSSAPLNLQQTASDSDRCDDPAMHTSRGGELSFHDRKEASSSGDSHLGGLRQRFLSFSRPSYLSTYRFRRFPRGTGVWLVFLIFFLYGVAEFSTTLVLFFALNAYHRLNPPQTVAVYLGARFLAFTMYPIMGFLADTFFGRYKVMLVCLHIAWIGSTILCLCFAFMDPYLDKDPSKYAYGSDTSWPRSRVATLTLCYGVMWAGFTGVRVNLIPFGVDQLPDASGGELSSYFHWYYWFIKAGYLFSCMAIPGLYKITALSYSFLITNFCFSCMIFLLVVLRFKLNIMPKIGNPFKLVYQVMRFVMKRKRPRYTSVFQLGQARPSRIDLAMTNHGGQFSVEQVEDVKTFFRILMILISFFGYFTIFSQLQSTYLMEAMRMKLPDGYYESCPDELLAPLQTVIKRPMECQLWKLSPSVWLTFANIIPVMLLLPILDRFVYPCFFGQTPSMLKRITIGKIFLLLSIVVAIGIETYRMSELSHILKDREDKLVINAIPFHTGSSTTLHVASSASICLIVPQYLLFAFADVLSSVTAVEFIYAQSPAQMKGILLGLLFGTEGIATGFASILIWLQDASPEFSASSFYGNSNFYYRNVERDECREGSIYKSCNNGPLFSYVVFLFVAIVSVVVFAISALHYKLRRRDPDTSRPWFHGGSSAERGIFNCCYQ